MIGNFVNQNEVKIGNHLWILYASELEGWLIEVNESLLKPVFNQLYLIKTWILQVLVQVKLNAFIIFKITTWFESGYKQVG